MQSKNNVDALGGILKLKIQVWENNFKYQHLD
jgi:hypothetical protein